MRLFTTSEEAWFLAELLVKAYEQEQGQDKQLCYKLALRVYNCLKKQNQGRALAEVMTSKQDRQ